MSHFIVGLDTKKTQADKRKPKHVVGKWHNCVTRVGDEWSRYYIKLDYSLLNLEISTHKVKHLITGVQIT